MKKLFSLLSILSICAGCYTPGSVVRQLKGDAAIVILEIGTPWGVQKVRRIGGTTNSVTISPDGTVTIKPPPLLLNATPGREDVIVPGIAPLRQIKDSGHSMLPDDMEWIDSDLDDWDTRPVFVESPAL